MNFLDTDLRVTGSTMDIYSESGTKVYYLGYNGYDSDRESANKFMAIGDVMTVKYVDVGSSSSTVYFEEFPNKGFNTVMFGELAAYRKDQVILNEIVALYDELKQTLEHDRKKRKKVIDALQ